MAGLSYDIAYVALVAALIIPMIITWVLTMILVSSQKDQARNGFSWLKAVFPFLLLALILNCASGALTIGVNTATVTSAGSAEAMYEMAPFTTFMGYIASVLALVALFKIGRGFLHVYDDARVHLRIMSIVMYAVCGLLLTLSAVIFVLSLHAYVTYFAGIHNRSSDGGYYSQANNDYVDNLETELRVASRISGVVEIIFFIMSLPILALGITVRNRSSKSPAVRSSAILFLTATIIWFISFVWHIVYTGMYILSTVHYVDTAVNVVSPLLGMWTFMAVLILLFIIGKRKAGGLWTRSRIWSNEHSNGIESPGAKFLM